VNVRLNPREKVFSYPALPLKIVLRGFAPPFAINNQDANGSK